MDQRSRFPDDTEILETLTDAVRSRIRKGGPVALTEDSKDGHTVSAQLQVQYVHRDQDGNVMNVTPSVLEDIPRHFAGGGGIHTTHMMKKGDEGVVVAGDGNQDFWHQQGGVQTPGDSRSHTTSDSIYFGGLHSTPNKLKGVSKNSTQVRTVDKQTLHDTSHTAVTSIREKSAHQVNGKAIQSEKEGSRHIVDGKTIQNVAGKILLNC